MIEYHILPAVRSSAGGLATALRWVLAACAVLAVAELVLLPMRLVLPGIVCGMVSTFLLLLGICMLAVLASWCHTVLLAGQGVVITRWLLRMGALLAPLAPACWAYTLFSGSLLLYRQAELPLILAVLLLSAALVNIPRMAAAPWQLQLRIAALPLLLLVVQVCDVPGMLWICTAFKLLTAWVAAAPLRQLAHLAPRIISMPEA